MRRGRRGRHGRRWNSSRRGDEGRSHRCAERHRHSHRHKPGRRCNWSRPHADRLSAWEGPGDKLGRRRRGRGLRASLPAPGEQQILLRLATDRACLRLRRTHRRRVPLRRAGGVRALQRTARAQQRLLAETVEEPHLPLPHRSALNAEVVREEGDEAPLHDADADAQRRDAPVVQLVLVQQHVGRPENRAPLPEQPAGDAVRREAVAAVWRCDGSRAAATHGV
mmetsp:Transcript_16760/g.54242  ORF Transcript_16760/g.54242 Transcript_16760/m.54242 type:complete len:223 (-) Transcript_16760:662-1330(-)